MKLKCPVTMILLGVALATLVAYVVIEGARHGTTAPISW